jgi:hypothetical protein
MKKLYLLRSHHGVWLYCFHSRVLRESRDSAFGIVNAALRQIQVSLPGTVGM